MYARKLKVRVKIGSEERACPLEWLDNFCMRDFTRSGEFDDTLPVGDGELEASFRVETQALAAALADWLTRRGKGDGQRVHVRIEESQLRAASSS